MKTVITKNMKGAILSMGLGLMSFVGFSQEHITVSLENITATANTIEYDMFVINDGSTALKLASCAFGVNYNGVILNGGTLSENSFNVIPGTRSQALSSLTNFFVKNTSRDNVNQLRATTTPVRIAQSAVLLSNVPYKVGRFKLTNSKPWTANSNPAFSFNEFSVPGISTTCATGYVDASSTPIGFSTAKKNLKVQVVNSPILNPTGIVDATLNGSVKMQTVGAESPAISRDGLSQTANNSKINIYPNPTHDILNIDVNSTSIENIVVKVLDIRGRIVKQIQTRSEKGLNTLTVSLAELASGNYNVQVYQDSKLSTTEKISKKD